MFALSSRAVLHMQLLLAKGLLEVSGLLAAVYWRKPLATSLLGVGLRDVVYSVFGGSGYFDHFVHWLT